ncbi:hypothetical protein [Plantactinospora mayteni]|uniref:hypothetical protein n=1 Tax=Plantactinospora mayteni TaxID=566021 RepID=UPI001942C3E2|nr:hypothetical protein [Plantactinospora mayteni]
MSEYDTTPAYAPQAETKIRAAPNAAGLIMRQVWQGPDRHLGDRGRALLCRPGSDQTVPLPPQVGHTLPW